MKEKIIGSMSQKETFKLYSEHVSRYKAEFFDDIGLAIVQGKREGVWLHTLEGIDGGLPLELIDCRTSGGVFNLGHNHPAIINAIREGLNAGLNIGDHHLVSEQRALLAKQLADLLPEGISKTQFCAGGGEAVDLAIKLARGITKRKKVISAKKGYHGVTGLALGAGAASFKEPFLWDVPDFVQIPFGDKDSLNSIDDSTACVIFETIPATGGILIAEEGYFTSIREKCDDHGVMMIADEVQTGLGRTGEMWGIYGGLYENEKIIPDIMVLGKGMSAGVYPLATVSYKPFIEEIFEDDPFLHISTTGGSELGCYICRKNLELLSDDKLLNHVKEMGNSFGKMLDEIKDKYGDLITDVRGRGLMWGMEFANDFTSLGFTLEMIKNGVFADYCGNFKETVKFMPPLIISEEEISIVQQRLEQAITALI